MDLTTVLRVVFSLGVVLALLWFSHRVAGRRTRSVARPGGEKLAVLARQGLTQKSAAVLLEAGGRRYLLGVTESSVTVIDRPEIGGTTFDDTFDDVVAALAAQDDDPLPGTAPDGAPRTVPTTAPATVPTTAPTAAADGAPSGVVDSLLTPATWRKAAQAVRGGLR